VNLKATANAWENGTPVGLPSGGTYTWSCTPSAKFKSSKDTASLTSDTKGIFLVQATYEFTQNGTSVKIGGSKSVEIDLLCITANPPIIAVGGSSVLTASLNRTDGTYTWSLPGTAATLSATTVIPLR